MKLCCKFVRIRKCEHYIKPRTMKRLAPLLTLILFPILLTGKGITFNLLSQTQASVVNGDNYSQRVLVYDKGRILLDQVLRPQESKIFPYKYHKSETKKITYRAVYDDRAFELDLQRLKHEKDIRDKRRAEEGLFWALGAFIDQVFFDGVFSSLFEIGNYGLMLINGATEEEWAEALMDSGVGFGIDQSLDDKYQKGLASGAYQFAKSIQPREYKDLQEWLIYFMRIRDSGYVVTGYITDTAMLPKRKAVSYPHFTISASLPLKQKFSEDAILDLESYLPVEAGSYNEELPFEFRLHYKLKHNMGYLLEYGKSGLFSNLGSADFQYLKTNTAFKFTSYSVGISPSYEFLELGMGVSFLKQDNFEIIAATNQLLMLEHTTKWGGFIEPRINIRLGNPVTAFASWRATVFTDRTILENTLELHHFKVGIGINFRRRVLDFSN